MDPLFSLSIVLFLGVSIFHFSKVTYRAFFKYPKEQRIPIRADAPSYYSARK